MGKLLGELADRLLCLALSGLAALFPAYYDDYRALLDHTAQESAREVERWTQQAADSGLSLSAFLERGAASASPALREEAQLRQAALKRAEGHAAASAALRDARPWEQPRAFWAHADPSLRSALAHRPRIVLDGRSLAYAGLGLALALLISALFRLLARPRRKAAPR